MYDYIDVVYIQCYNEFELHCPLHAKDALKLVDSYYPIHNLSHLKEPIARIGLHLHKSFTSHIFRPIKLSLNIVFKHRNTQLRTAFLFISDPNSMCKEST